MYLRNTRRRQRVLLHKLGATERTPVTKCSAASARKESINSKIRLRGVKRYELAARVLNKKCVCISVCVRLDYVRLDRVRFLCHIRLDSIKIKRRLDWAMLG